MKRIISLLIVITMFAVLFVGCSGSKTADSDESSANEDKQTEKVAEDSEEKTVEKVKLKYWALSRWKGINGTEPDGQFGDWQRDIAERFMKDNPNVEDIEFEHIPGSDIQQKTTVAIASKTQPDVLEDGCDRGSMYARMGALVPLNDYFAKEDMDDFIEGSWENGGIKIDGQYHMIPWSNSVQMMLINRDLFEKAGALDLLPQNEEKSWTYEEFRTALESVSKLDGVFGTVLFFSSTAGDAYVTNIIMGSGSKLVNETGEKVIYNSPETEKGIEYLKSLTDDGLAVPGAETLAYSDAKELFKQQKVATSMMGSFGYIPELESEFDVDWALFPNAPGKEPVLKANYIGYLVFRSGDENREKAAVELAKFATNTENSKALKIVNLVPLRRSCGDLYTEDGDAAWQKDAAAWQKKIFKYAIDPGFFCPAFAQIRAAHAPMMQAVVTGSMTAKEALIDFEKQVQSEIDKVLEK